MQNNPLRTLARSTLYQSLYIHSKNVKGKIFKNDSDFSYIQVLFLQWLEIYHNIYLDISDNKSLIDDEMIIDDILVDSYLFYKRNKNKKDANQDNLPVRNSSFQVPSLTFVQRRKKK